MPSAPKAQLRRVITLAKSTGLPTRILPVISELAMGKVIYKQVREIRIEDLLGRKPVDLRIPEVADYLLGERVLITGAGGSIGSELCRQVVPFKPESILLLGKGENSIYEIHQELTEVYPEQRIVPIIADVRDREKIEQIMNEYRPTVIFHAAAHKHVPLMEIAPDEAVKNNIFGTKNMAELADKHQVKKFVMISTDKAVNPTSIMGATKRVAEMIIQMMAAESQTKFCAVRFGNVLGSRGSVIPLFKKQIAKGGPVTITHPEMVRFFMTIPEAASLVIQAGALGERGEIFILDMGEPVRILDLAQDLIKLSGYEPGKDIEIKYCGIRPGEKLYEEILTAEEGTTATKYERIYVGKPNGLNQSKLMEDLVYLEQCVSAEDKGKIVEKLRQMVPKYKPSQRWLQEIAAGIDEKN
jgi:FlaA1/EpsC-like NDP-sugar epimerase